MRITRAKQIEAASDLMPGAMVFVLILLDPRPPEVVPWITMAYSPLLLWALIRKVEEDRRLFGVPVGKGARAVRIMDLAMQTALLGLLAVFVKWQF